MPSPAFTLYQDDSTPGGAGTPITDSNPISFLNALRGALNFPTPSSAFHAWNDKDGSAASDTATMLELGISSDDPDSPIFTGTSINNFSPMLEARSTGSFNCPSDSQVNWTPIGLDDILMLGDMPSQSMRIIELRLNVPSDAPDNLSTVNFSFQINYA